MAGCCPSTFIVLLSRFSVFSSPAALDQLPTDTGKGVWIVVQGAGELLHDSIFLNYLSWCSGLQFITNYA